MAKKSVTKNYIYNLMYQIMTLILPLITAPYISRVLGAENIGIYSYTLSISAYFILFGSLGIALYGQREIAYKQKDKEKYKTQEENIMSFNWKATGLFAAGVAFGTAGIKVLSSKDAKKAYTHCTAATLRAKDFVMKTVNTVQENAEDIYAEAKSINEERAAAAEAKAIEDAKEEEAKAAAKEAEKEETATEEKTEE